MKFRVFVTNIYLQSRMKYTRDEKKKEWYRCPKKSKQASESRKKAESQARSSTYHVL